MGLSFPHPQVEALSSAASLVRSFLAWTRCQSRSCQASILPPTVRGPELSVRGSLGGPGRTEGVSPSLLIHLRLALAQTDPQEQRRPGSEIKQLLSGAKGPPPHPALKGRRGAPPGPHHTPPHPPPQAPTPADVPSEPAVAARCSCFAPRCVPCCPPGPPCPVRGVGLSPGALRGSWGVGCIFVGCRTWGCFVVVCFFGLSHHASWRVAQGLWSLHPKNR